MEERKHWKSSFWHYHQEATPGMRNNKKTWTLCEDMTDMFKINLNIVLLICTRREVIVNEVMH